MATTGKQIFISHSSQDKSLADELVDLMHSGMQVPKNLVYQSSHPGRGTPPGKDFISQVRKNLRSAKIVILILTPNFFSSAYCVGEMGVAWWLSSRKDVFPFILPYMKASEVTGLLKTADMGSIDSADRLNQLYDRVAEKLDLSKVVTDWDQARAKFLKRLPGVVKELSGPQSVPVAVLNAETTRLAEAQQKNAELVKLLEEKDKQIKEVIAAKTIEEAQKIAGTSAEEAPFSAYPEFRATFLAIRITLRKLPNMVVDALYADFCGVDFPEYTSVLGQMHRFRVNPEAPDLVHAGYLKESKYHIRPNYEHADLISIRENIQRLQRQLRAKDTGLKERLREELGTELDLRHKRTWEILLGAEFVDI